MKHLAALLLAAACAAHAADVAPVIASYFKGAMRVDLYTSADTFCLHKAPGHMDAVVTVPGREGYAFACWWRLDPERVRVHIDMVGHGPDIDLDLTRRDLIPQLYNKPML